MNQTLAIFIDAYRELNARKLFWITLSLSTLVALAFLAVGIDSNGISLFGAHLSFLKDFNTSIIERPLFFKGLFLNLGVGLWLTWIATILALISTAGIFPDLLSGGSIDLFLSKPIGRLRLFLTKYAAGLAFVFLQVLAFSFASFLLLGIRGGTWEPSVFLAVPVVVVFFSYLYCVCVLLGVMTRSTVASILLTILFWLLILGIHTVEVFSLDRQLTDKYSIERCDRQIAQREADLKALDAQEPTSYRETKRTFITHKLDEVRKERADAASSSSWHPIFFGIKTVLPKTSETVALLERWLVSGAELKGKQLPDNSDDDEEVDRNVPRRFGPDGIRAQRELRQIIRSRSVGWVAGTSLAFEAVVVAWAAWIFCRRDY